MTTTRSLRLLPQPEGITAIWLGALSFEERCLGALSTFLSNRNDLIHTVMLDYSPSVTVDGRSESMRANHALTMRQMLARANQPKPDFRPIDAYSFREMRTAALSLIEEARLHSATLVLDVTCLTKLHTLAAIGTLVLEGFLDSLVISYSRPLNYPSMAEWLKEFSGWRDIVVAPLGRIGSLENQPESRGLVLLGHEGRRLTVALTEIEPTVGTLVLARAPDRPDLTDVARDHNRSSRRRFIRSGSGWREISIGLLDVDQMEVAVDLEVRRAREREAPVLFYPFGPKPLIVASALRLSQTYLERSCFVYPIPTMYDPGYTDGLGDVTWMGLSLGE